MHNQKNLQLMESNQSHWENIYQTKDSKKVGWYQERPIVSLGFFEEFIKDKNEAVLDVGGGDSLLVDHLIALGYQDVSVLDISTTSLNKAKERFGKNAEKIDWIHSDITAFTPDRTYDVWHDRAVFHFLREDDKIKSYIDIASSALESGSWLFIGTFSEEGPETCSGLPVKRYTKEALANSFSQSFDCVKSFNMDHITPSGAVQNYSFCYLRKK
jgi:SAM-dependent methyltransferase